MHCGGGTTVTILVADVVLIEFEAVRMKMVVCVRGPDEIVPSTGTLPVTGEIETVVQLVVFHESSSGVVRNRWR